MCVGHAPAIKAKVEAGLSAQRIFQDLTEEQGYAGSYEAVKRFAACAKAPRGDTMAPGAEAQIDFGTGAWIVDEHGQAAEPCAARGPEITAGHNLNTRTSATDRRTHEIPRVFRSILLPWPAYMPVTDVHGDIFFVVREGETDAPGNLAHCPPSQQQYQRIVHRHLTRTANGMALLIDSTRSAFRATNSDHPQGFS